MSEITQSTEVFGLTERAAARILELSKGESANAVLRVSVKGGGCSGFQYEFSLGDTKNTEDLEISKDHARVLVDATSLPFLSGSVLDYEVTLGSAQFVVTNPNATAKCGCGKSFGV